MLTFNRRFYMFGNYIARKDGKTYYILPAKLSTEIRSKEVDKLDHSLKTFLASKDILIEDNCIEDTRYCPFVNKNAEYNGFRLFIQLTGNCNLKCKHCFLGGSSNCKNYYTLDAIRKLILDAVRLGIRYIDLTGGEIFTVDFLPELLTFIDSLPISSNLFTNLAFLSDGQLKRIIDCSSVRCVITSLDYFTAEKHDSFRGAVGAFASTMHSIHALRNAGIPVTVNCMILKDNHTDIEKMIEYFPRIGAGIHFDTVICKGNAEKNRDMFSQSAQIEDIPFISRCVEQINLSGSLLDYMKKDKCGVGKSLLYTDRQGNFQLCPGLTREDDEIFFLGRTIEDAAAGLLRLSVGCNDTDCKYHSICSYGCRERALKEGGSIYSPDLDVCELLKLLEESNRGEQA